jgi:hypothetical protein
VPSARLWRPGQGRIRVQGGGRARFRGHGPAVLARPPPGLPSAARCPGGRCAPAARSAGGGRSAGGIGQRAGSVSGAFVPLHMACEARPGHSATRAEHTRHRPRPQRASGVNAAAVIRTWRTGWGGARRGAVASDRVDGDACARRAADRCADGQLIVIPRGGCPFSTDSDFVPGNKAETAFVASHDRDDRGPDDRCCDAVSSDYPVPIRPIGTSLTYRAMWIQLPRDRRASGDRKRAGPHDDNRMSATFMSTRAPERRTRCEGRARLGITML